MKIIDKSILTEIKKVLVIYLIVLLLLGRFSPLLVLAEEPEETPPPETQQIEPSPDPTPTPSPSPETEVEIDNQAEVTNEVDSTAISGENTIEEPSPSPLALPEGTVGEEGTEQTEEVCETECGTTDESDEVVETTTDEFPSPSPAVVDTGDAVSVVEVENSVNSTEANSQILFQTLNIFVSGDIDLTTVPLAIAEAVFSQNNNDLVINVSVIDSENFAYLSNEIVSLANTGGNTIEGGQEAIISTGDACSIVSLLNEVNTTIVNSTIHIVTINIFGDVQGNVLLPEFSSEEGCCGEVVHLDNKATVENDVGSTAISGQNSITTASTEDASINTGSANSAVNLVNVVNTNLIGVVFYQLFINVFGEWSGDFLGWDDFGFIDGGDSLALSSVEPGGNGDYPTCFDYVSVGNEAQVVNNVSSTANTGGNSINGDGGTINTSNAYSSVSLVNFVNSTIINSLGFFGFINIFGFLDGDIGGASLFATSSEPAEPEPEVEVENTSNQDSGPSVQEEGGQLEVYQENNVGTHVLPGDTITFFVTIKNPGTGRVYDPELNISFIKDGVDMGGAIFDLDNIEAGKGVKMTTGLVLSQEAEPGDYIATAVATGHVGPDNNLISAYTDKLFRIAGSLLPLVSGVTEEAQAAESGGEILGAMTDKGLTITQKLWLLLLVSLVAYLAMKATRERRKLALAWSHRREFFKTKGATIHSIVMRLSSFLS